MNMMHLMYFCLKTEIYIHIAGRLLPAFLFYWINLWYVPVCIECIPGFELSSRCSIVWVLQFVAGTRNSIVKPEAVCVPRHNARFCISNGDCLWCGSFITYSPNKEITSASYQDEMARLIDLISNFNNLYCSNLAEWMANENAWLGFCSFWSHTSITFLPRNTSTIHSCQGQAFDKSL